VDNIYSGKNDRFAINFVPVTCCTRVYDCVLFMFVCVFVCVCVCVISARNRITIVQSVSSIPDNDKTPNELVEDDGVYRRGTHSLSRCSCPRPLVPTQCPRLARNPTAEQCIETTQQPSSPLQQFSRNQSSRCCCCCCCFHWQGVSIFPGPSPIRVRRKLNLRLTPSSSPPLAFD